MPKPIVDMGASVRGRLLNLSRETDRPFDLAATLARFFSEAGSRSEASCIRAASRLARAAAIPTSGQAPKYSVFCRPR